MANADKSRGNISLVAVWSATGNRDIEDVYIVSIDDATNNTSNEQHKTRLRVNRGRELAASKELRSTDRVGLLLLIRLLVEYEVGSVM